MAEPSADETEIAREQADKFIRTGAKFFVVPQEVTCEDARAFLEQHFLAALAHHSAAKDGEIKELRAQLVIEAQTNARLGSTYQAELAVLRKDKERLTREVQKLKERLRNQ